MGKNRDVEVLDDMDARKLSGEEDGYSYKFIESIDNSHAAYAVTNPDGDCKMVSCTSDGASELADSPRDFWDNHIKK
jgi:hypothetical protein